MGSTAPFNILWLTPLPRLGQLWVGTEMSAGPGREVRKRVRVSVSHLPSALPHGPSLHHKKQELCIFRCAIGLRTLCKIAMARMRASPNVYMALCKVVSLMYLTWPIHWKTRCLHNPAAEPWAARSSHNSWQLSRLRPLEYARLTQPAAGLSQLWPS